MDAMTGQGDTAPAKTAPLVYRQFAWTRITHWVWAISLFFLLLTGLQIFNAHPALYIGDQSGFQFENDVLVIGAENTENGPRGFTRILGAKFDTSGVLGMSGPEGQPRYVAFPGWATIPSYHDLATGRVIHFFFAWLLVGTLLAWLVASLINGHLRRDLVPGVDDVRRLPRDIADHARLRFHHTRDYNTLQKFTYADRAVHPVPADDPDRAGDVAWRQCAAAVPARTSRRTADGTHDPFRRHGAAGRLLRRSTY